MNALDTRINALSNNIAGTSEKKKGYTEDETEKDFLDAKSDDGKYDKFELRNRTVTETETLSLVSDFGKDAKENGNEGEENGQEPKTGENKMNDDDVQQDTSELRNRTVNEVLEPVDTLELRNRTVNEIFSPVADLGQDTKNETEKKDAGDPKPKENKKNMEVSETREAERNKRESNVSEPITDVMEIRDQGGGGGRKGRQL